MISKASCSKTALPAAAAASSTQLAPGFRFHPTDEELVSYYLKRKVTGRRIHVDAISEVDIYSSEPRDLPPQSRLRSRDLEWYFFTSLDRKYSNRCRTNRATAEGYWKTTGKDRPIQRRSRTIGMKKTLVYHSGRAPRGQRSNWVMHEYRLKDEDLARAEIPQDGYVLCRIFQKSGPGPQNGAQYGAPFMEEEWEREEEEDANFVPMNVDGADGLMGSAGHGYVQLGDFLQDPESGIQHLDAVPFGERSSGQDFSSHTEDSSIFVEGLFKVNDSVDDMPQNADFTALQDSETTMNGLEERNGLEDQSNCTSIMNNGYVQLKDIFGEETTNSASNVCSTDCPFKNCYNSLEDGVDQSSILPQNYVEGDSLNTNGVTSQLDQVQMSPAVQHDIYPETYDSVGNLPWEYPSSQLADDDLVYYDALSHEVPYLEDSFTYKTSLAPEFDFPEGLMEYYDAKNDNINYAPPDSFLPQASSQQVQSEAFHEIVRSRNSLSNEAFYVGENLARNASSGCPATGDGSSSDFTGVPADVKPKDCQDNTLTKRLASMLDSISAPPAFADEAASIGKTAQQIPATSRSVLHVSAGMIQIENVTTTMGCPESWTLQKHSELRFLLSYGVYGNMVSKSISHEPRNKVLGGFLSSFFRGGFYLFFLSAFMLALSFKLMVYVYNM